MSARSTLLGPAGLSAVWGLMLGQGDGVGGAGAGLDLGLVWCGGTALARWWAGRYHFGSAAARSSNGRTSDSGSGGWGSSPCRAAKISSLLTAASRRASSY